MAETTIADVGANIEAINYTKNGKSAFGSVFDLVVDDTLNIRFHEGSEVFGVRVEKDSRDLPGMWNDIVQAGRIIEPIWVSERADGLRIVVRGNRRVGAAQKYGTDPTISAELRDALTKRTPMLIFKGLSLQQEREMVQDQTQKKFQRSEIVRHIFHLRKSGWNYEQIVIHNWQKLAEMFSTQKQRAEFESISEPAARLEKLKSWFNGSCRTYLLNGYDMGAWMQKQIMLSEMRFDGLLTKEGIQPYFFTNVNSQKRMNELRTAKNKDGERFNGLMPLEVENSEFAALAKKYHAEDYPENGVTPPKNPVGVLTKQAIEDLKKIAQSKHSQNLLNVVLKQNGEWQQYDERAMVIETKMMLVEQYLPRLKPEMAALVRLCLVNPDPTDFKEFLDKNCGNPSEPSNKPEPGNADTFSLNENNAG